MIHTIQLAGSNTIGGLVLALVVPTVMIAFGSYVGVLMALQSFFDAQSWQEATADSEQ